MLSSKSVFVNVCYDANNKFPENGFLKYPYVLLRAYGVKARFWASYWAMSSTPRPTYSPAPLAACGCMPAKTIKGQIAELVRNQVLLPLGREYRPTHDAWIALSQAYSVELAQPFVK